MTQTRTTPPPEETEASRLRILRAAAEIAAEWGYEGTTISKVTKRSGLPASSVYWFFEDKEHLLAEVVRHSFTEWIARQPAWGYDEHDRRPVGEALRAILSRSVRSLSDAPDFMRIGQMLLLESRRVEPEGRRIFMQVRDDVEQAIRTWFTAHLEPAVRVRRPELAADLARIVIAATDGLFLAHQIGDPSDPDDFVALLVAIVDDAVGAA
jgi:AcrR family transcriptional regulator